MEADVVYNERSDQWGVPGERGFLFYAVVRDRATVVVYLSTKVH